MNTITGYKDGHEVPLYIAAVHFFAVLVGAFLLALFVVESERWILVMTGSQFLSAVVGVWMANMVAQFGVTPRQLLVQLSMNFVAVIIVSLAQGHWFGTGWFTERGSFRRQDA